MVSRLHTVMPAASKRGRCTRSASSPTGTRARAYKTCAQDLKGERRSMSLHQPPTSSAAPLLEGCEPSVQPHHCTLCTPHQLTRKQRHTVLGLADRGS